MTNRANKQAAVKVIGSNGSNATIDTVIAAGDKDRFNKYTKMTINGYPALKHVITFIGPSQAETYTDISYTLIHDQTTVSMAFRQSYSNATINHQQDFDVSSVTPQFEAMVQSVRIK